jgi:hypothetical protein
MALSDNKIGGNPIDKELPHRDPDPQLRLAEAAEEIAIQLKELNKRLDTTINDALTQIATNTALR